MRFLFNIFFFSVSGIAICVNAQESFYNREIKAEILMEDQAGLLDITGIASNLTNAEQSIRYELAVIKKDTTSSNIIKNNQTGEIVLKVKSQAILSKTRLNLNVPDIITILLLIYDTDDNLIGKDLKRIEPNTYGLEEKKINTFDGIEIRGIVTRNLRTAPARKFYDYFYKQYKKYQINGVKVVTINEKFGLGRNSRIEILVGNDKVHQFFLNPTDDFIYEMGDYSIRLVYQQFQKLKSMENAINNY